MAREQKEIRITGVSSKMHEQVTNVAKNKYGITVGEFMKGKLMKILDEIPEHDKNKKPA